MSRLNKFLCLLESEEYTIFVDMDGVICNFIKAASKTLNISIKDFKQWKSIKKAHWKDITDAGSEFWSDMEWMPDGKELWNYIKKYNPEVLSAYPFSTDSPQTRKNAIKGKVEWIKKHLSGVKKINLVKGRDKQTFAHSKAILIDDSERNIKQFIDAGGIGILHKNTKDSISQLKKII